MKPGGGRRKGHDWERAVAKMLRAVFPNARRTGDGLRGTNDLAGIPFAVECKAGGPAKRPYAALDQAIENSDGGLYPVAICKRDRRPPVAMMLLVDWFELVREWKERGR